MKIPTCSLIRGYGIGPEITDASVRVIEAAGGKFTWDPVPAGMGAVDTHKDPLPQITLDSITANRLALKGPLGTPIGGGFRSVNVALRQTFDLYANVRPARTLAGVPSRYETVDLIVMRENTEDLYAGVEHYVDPRRNAAESIAIITRFGSTRIAEYAFDYARKHGRKKVTTVHKANILKMSNGLFLECARHVAKEFPEIAHEEMIVDACCMKLVQAPERFDVILTMNLFGDIMSDLCAGLVGGLGVAPAGNIGSDAAIFEAVHGTAPDIAGQGIANPTALMLSGAMMCDHVGQGEAGDRIRRGVYAALARPESRTKDLGGACNTAQYAEAVIRKMA
jgi:isocitrate dehydrogenase (NAD+)